jgi:hypothetical protein
MSVSKLWVYVMSVNMLRVQVCYECKEVISLSKLGL